MDRYTSSVSHKRIGSGLYQAVLSNGTLFFLFLLSRIENTLYLYLRWSTSSHSKYVFAARGESIPIIRALKWVATALIHYQGTLSDLPAGVIPNGLTPNFVNPETLVPKIVAVSIVMIVLALFFVIIRLYANFYGRHGLGIDDCKSCSYAPGQSNF